MTGSFAVKTSSKTEENKAPLDAGFVVESEHEVEDECRFSICVSRMQSINKKTIAIYFLRCNDEVFTFAE